MPFISVLIPLYNKENFVEKTIQSALDQTYQDFEVVVINDGSTDKSLEIVKSFKDKRIKIFNQDNQGVAKARNNGVNNSQGEWVAFLDADDVWLPNHLSELRKCIHKLPKAKLVSTAYKINLQPAFIKTPTYSKAPSNYIDYIQDYLEYCYVDSLFWTSSICVNKEKFIEIGGFDNNLKTGEDLDFMIRFSQKYDLGFNPIYTITYNRKTENNLSDSHTLYEKKKYIDKHQSEEDQDQILKKYLDINRYSLALQAKTNYNNELYKETLSEIDLSNLNSKQKFLIKQPAFALIQLKKIQLLLLSRGMYKSAFT